MHSIVLFVDFLLEKLKRSRMVSFHNDIATFKYFVRLSRYGSSHNSTSTFVYVTSKHIEYNQHYLKLAS